MNMPGIDGISVMAALRLRWPVPIILVTGGGTVARMRDGLDRGADDYVTKPFAPRELAARAIGVPAWAEGPIRSVPGVGYVLDRKAGLHTRAPAW